MSLPQKIFAISPITATSIWFAVSIYQPVYAQNSSYKILASSIQEVTVTVQRREQNILDVPYNITAVSGDEIAAAFTRDSAELLRSIPGVSQIDQGPRNAAQFSSIRIRGLNVDSSANSDYAVASVATVSTYVNETPVYANLALIDLDRVEILRGPQATLYGSGALGGTIKYFLNEPVLGEVEGSLGTSLSSVNGSDGSLRDRIGYATTGVANFPLSDTVAVRANVYWQDYPGITDYTNLYQLDNNGVPVQTGGLYDTGASSTAFTKKADADTYQSLYGRIALSWLPSNDFELLATYIYQDDEVGGRRAQSEGLNGFGEAYADYEQGSMILEPSERTFDMFSIEATIDLGFATLTSASSYYDNNGSNKTDNTGFYANNFADLYLNYPRPLYTAERTFLDKAFVQEIRLVGDIGEQFDYVIGGFHRDNDQGFTQVSDLMGYANWYAFPAGVNTDNVFTYQRNENYIEDAGFGELTWHANERLHMTFGARYFEVDSEVKTFARVSAYTDFANPTSTLSSVSENDLLLKGNVAFEFADDDLLYLTVSEGFRRGGNNAVSTDGALANDLGWVVYNSDTVLNHEIGVKGIVNAIRYDLSVFYIEWNDPQFNTSTPVNTGSFFSVVNGDQAETKGVELQLSGTINDRLSYAFGYAYVNAKLSADLLTPIDTQIAINGASLPGVPEHAINLALDHFQSLSPSLDLALRLDGFYQSETQNIIDEGMLQSVEFSGFDIWGASASLLCRNWTGSLFIKNIFNEAGVTGSFTPEAFGPQSSAEFYGSNSRAFITLPRTIGLAINYQF
ncbi:MAG: TonB-dependent receptor [Pseudomonadales bacterium]